MPQTGAILGDIVSENKQLTGSVTVLYVFIKSLSDSTRYIQKGYSEIKHNNKILCKLVSWVKHNVNKT